MASSEDKIKETFFLKIPMEIRHLIYEELLRKDPRIPIELTDFSHRTIASQQCLGRLKSACRQTNKEIRDWFTRSPRLRNARRWGLIEPEKMTFLITVEQDKFNCTNCHHNPRTGCGFRNCPRSNVLRLKRLNFEEMAKIHHVKFDLKERDPCSTDLVELREQANYFAVEKTLVLRRFLRLETIDILLGWRNDWARFVETDLSGTRPVMPYNHCCSTWHPKSAGYTTLPSVKLWNTYREIPDNVANSSGQNEDNRRGNWLERIVFSVAWLLLKFWGAEVYKLGSESDEQEEEWKPVLLKVYSGGKDATW
jgi:hypothetical protein